MLTFTFEYGPHAVGERHGHRRKERQSLWAVGGRVWDRETMRSTDPKAMPFLLIRGIDDARPGPVVTFFYEDNPRYMEAEENLQVQLGGEEYRFGFREAGDGVLLVLLNENARQILAPFDSIE